jgi:hypothetical protein
MIKYDEDSIPVLQVAKENTQEIEQAEQAAEPGSTRVEESNDIAAEAFITNELQDAMDGEVAEQETVVVLREKKTFVEAEVASSAFI